MSHLWFDRQGNPISIEEALPLIQSDRRIAHDVVVLDGEPVWVSTAFIVLNQEWMPERPPLIFETMILGGGELDTACWRYPTEEAALAGHDQVMAMLNERVTAQ